MSTKVAILGHGIIGGGVSRILLEQQGELELAALCTIDPQQDPLYQEHPELFLSFEHILQDERIEIVVETIGGVGVALDFVRQCLGAGKSVVTANKEMIAKHFLELHKLAKENNVALLFEAAVGGGIPLLAAMKYGLSGEQLESIAGIINGTTNYILTQMEAEGLSFNEALQEAQAKGFAEADPSNDIEGKDAAYKLSILGILGFGVLCAPECIPTRGITELQKDDFYYAQVFEKKIKLLAIAKKSGEHYTFCVTPALVDADSPLGKTDGVVNAALLKGAYNSVGNFLSGEGAGRFPTAAAIVSDCQTIARGAALLSKTPKVLSENEPQASGFYLRFQIHDRPGIIAELSAVLAKYAISIDAVHQQANQEGDPHFAMTLEPVSPVIMEQAMEEIRQLSFHAARPLILPFVQS